MNDARDLDKVDTLAGLARSLRDLHLRAGRPSYRDLARITSSSKTTIAEVFAGKRLPRMAFVAEFVDFCGAAGADTAGTVRDWERAWQRVAADRDTRGDGPPQYQERRLHELREIHAAIVRDRAGDDQAGAGREAAETLANAQRAADQLLADADSRVRRLRAEMLDMRAAAEREIATLRATADREVALWRAEAAHEVEDRRVASLRQLAETRNQEELELRQRIAREWEQATDDVAQMRAKARREADGVLQEARDQLAQAEQAAQKILRDATAKAAQLTRPPQPAPPPRPRPRAEIFEDVDVPDFLKNGS